VNCLRATVPEFCYRGHSEVIKEPIERLAAIRIPERNEATELYTRQTTTHRNRLVLVLVSYPGSSAEAIDTPVPQGCPLLYGFENGVT
jgi:hypothetical protein